MKTFLPLIIGLLFAASCTAAEVAPVRNLTLDFSFAWDATRDQPMPERVAAMKRTLLPLYPEFYGRGSPEEQDAKMPAPSSASLRFATPIWTRPRSSAARCSSIC